MEKKDEKKISRVVKKKEEKVKNYYLLKLITILMLMYFMVVSINIVDNAFKEINKIENTKGAIGYKYISDTMYELYVGDKKIYIDKVKLKDKYISIKGNVENMIDKVQNRIKLIKE